MQAAAVAIEPRVTGRGSVRDAHWRVTGCDIADLASAHGAWPARFAGMDETRREDERMHGERGGEPGGQQQAYACKLCRVWCVSGQQCKRASVSWRRDALRNSGCWLNECFECVSKAPSRSCRATSRASTAATTLRPRSGRSHRAQTLKLAPHACACALAQAAGHSAGPGSDPSTFH